MSAGGRQRGVNLVELIISIVIISIACTGVLLIFAQTVRYSADPMIQTQALAIAEAYLDEILARPVTDPDGTNAGETRASYDNVADYAAIVNESPPRDQNGAVADFAPADSQPDLAGYRVDVVVANVTVNTVAMSRVDVRVRFGAIIDVTLTGYRAP